MQYFKTAVLRRKAEPKRSCCVCQRSYYQKKRADKPCAWWLTDYRPCVYASGSNRFVYELDLFYFLADFEHTKRNL